MKRRPVLPPVDRPVPPSEWVWFCGGWALVRRDGK